MTDLFLKLVNMSITASWLVLAVIVLRFVLKKAPKAIHCGLWALVAVRLICPFTLESNLSLLPQQEPISAQTFQSETAIPSPRMEYGIVTHETPTGEMSLSEPVMIVEHTGAPFSAVLPEYLSAVWVAGMVLLLVYAGESWIRIHCRVAPSVRIGGNVWICDHIDSPFILGILHPRIYLPSALESRDADYVLAHERSHLQRKDHWWKPLGFLLLCVYWFNPVIWVAYILLCRDIEMACDEKVVKEMDMGEKKAYSTALLNCSLPRHMIAACPLAFGEASVKSRIKNVLNYKKPTFWVVCISVILCVLAALCLLTDPESDVESTAENSNPSKIENGDHSWDISALSHIENNWERYEYLICYDFDSRFVSFFDPQIIGNDLFVGVRYSGTQLGAARFEQVDGKYQYRDGYRFSDFSPAEEDSLWSVTVVTEENSYTLYLTDDASLSAVPRETERLQVLLNSGMEHINWNLPQEILDENYNYFDPQYYGNSLFLGAQKDRLYTVLHFEKNDRGRYDYQNIYYFISENIWGTSFPVCRISTPEGERMLLLVQKKDTTGLQFSAIQLNYIRISRTPSIVVLEESTGADAVIDPLTKNPPIMDVSLSEAGIPVFHQPESGMLNPYYLYLNHVSYYDGVHKPGLYSLEDSELTYLISLLSAVPEGCFIPCEKPQRLPLHTDLTVYTSDGKRQQSNQLDLRLCHTGEEGYLILYTGQYVHPFTDARHFRIEDQTLNTYLLSLCDDSRREVTVGAQDVDNPLVYTHGDVTIRVIPFWNWEYEVVEYTDENTPFGIRGRPETQSEGWIFFSCWPSGFASNDPFQNECILYGDSSDSTQEELQCIQNFREDPESIHDRERVWSSISFPELLKNFAVINDGADPWFADHSNEIGFCWDIHTFQYGS